MGLMEILQELGADKPFNNKGNYTDDGLIAYEKLLRIIDGLDCIGALGKTGDELESYLSEIVKLEF